MSYNEDFITSVDNKKQVDAIYSDFTEAFDKVILKNSVIFLDWLLICLNAHFL